MISYKFYPIWEAKPWFNDWGWCLSSCKTWIEILEATSLFSGIKLRIFTLSTPNPIWRETCALGLWYRPFLVVNLVQMKKG